MKEQVLEKSGKDILVDEIKRLTNQIVEKDKIIKNFLDKFFDLLTMPGTDEDYTGIVVIKDEQGKWKFVGFPCEKCVSRVFEDGK